MPLPDSKTLGAALDPSTLAEPTTIASEWLRSFSNGLVSGDPETVASFFLEDSYWRDILVLTWDLRTFHGRSSIELVLRSRLPKIQFGALRVRESPLHAPVVISLHEGLKLLQLCFDFETAYGKGTAICRLALCSGNIWKVFTMYTCLDSLENYPQRIGALRNPELLHRGTWEEARQREVDFKDRQPTVLVIGAGHTGLEIAANLKAFGIDTLVVDRNSRIGDNWRTRYKSLCLHDTCWYSESSFFKYPVSWPVYAPAPKFADWLESYAHTLELDVWLNSSISKLDWSEDNKEWNVTIQRDGSEEAREFNVKHVVFATGFGAGNPRMPEIPGQDAYKGTVLHSARYQSAASFAGKKVIVVGACNSGHDIAYDLHNYGAAVTMVQRSSTYIVSSGAVAQALGRFYYEGNDVDFADHMMSSLPSAVTMQLDPQDIAQQYQTVDKTIYEGLKRAGFSVNTSMGALNLFFSRGGGYYIDTGASKLIADGIIKLKGGVNITRFTEDGLEFSDGTHQATDVVIFATGYGDARDTMKGLCAPEVAEKVGPLWGLDKEGELNGVWRPSGHPRLWFGLGNMHISRFHSKHLAIQIKAIEEGIYDGSPA